jgi:hypothetical protein
MPLHTRLPILLVAVGAIAACSRQETATAPSDLASPAAFASAANTVDPSTLTPAAPPGAECHADGNWIICHTALSFAPVNEPNEELPCGVVYQTGTDERRGIRWYTSDGLLAKRFVSQDAEFTWSLSAAGAGPLLTVSVHSNWRNVYAVPGDESTGPQVTHGNGLMIRQPGEGVIVHLAGLNEADDTHHGVARFFDDPAVAAELCAALTR